MENSFTSYLRLKKTSIKQEENDEQQDDDFPVHYFQWTSDSTNLLLKLRFDEERHSKFEDRSFQRKELWDEIAAEMNRIGAHQVSGDVCDLKYRNLLHTYKKNRNKELNGTVPENISWSYYEIFKQALKSNEIKEEIQADETNDNSQTEEGTSNSNNSIKRKRSSNKLEVMEFPVTPFTELRAPSARLTNRRLHNALAQASQHQQQHSTPLIEPASKVKVAHNDHRNPSLALQTNHLSGFELEECRVFGETVGIQLSLIKSAEIRALAQLKIQEILYAAKVSKLKE